MIVMKNINKNLVKIFRDNWFGIFKLVLWAVVLFVLLHSLKKPDEPTVMALYMLVKIFGLLAVLYAPIVLSAVSQAFDITILFTLMTAFLNYILALSLIGDFGDTAYHSLQENPVAVFSFVATGIITWWIASFAIKPYINLRMAKLNTAHSALGYGAATRPVFVKPSLRDNQYSAAHEIGHVMLYAAIRIDEIPSDVRVVLNDLPDRQGVLGFVTGIETEHTLEEKTFAEWHMLVYLAGKVAESAMFSESTLGATSDNKKWLRLAHVYLSNNYRGVFYSSPMNEFEQNHNQNMLDKLHTEQLEMLQRFFDLNAKLHQGMFTALLDKRSLAIDDLVPFFSEVVFPQNFPLLK